MGVVENYGADSEADAYLVNRDGTCDYGDFIDPAEIGAYKVCAEDNINMEYKGKEQRTFKQFRGNVQGGQPKIGFRKMETNFGKAGDRKRNSEDRHARLAHVEGLSSDGAFDIRGQCRSQAGNKPSRFGRGNTDRFNAQCPIWKAKQKRWTSTNPASKAKGGKGSKGRTGEKKMGPVRFSFLGTSGKGPIVGGISGNQVTVSARQVNISGIFTWRCMEKQELAHRTPYHYRRRIQRRRIT